MSKRLNPWTPLNIIRLLLLIIALIGFGYYTYWDGRIVRSSKFGWDRSVPLTQNELDFYHSRYNHQFVGYAALIAVLVAICPLLSPVIRQTKWLANNIVLQAFLILYWAGTLAYLIYRLSGAIPYYVDFSGLQYVFWPFAFIGILLFRAEMMAYGKTGEVDR